MNDLDLLEKHEVVLGFASSECFFTMAVGPCLKKSVLFPGGPAGVAVLASHFNVPLAARIGKLHSEQYFLRFVNDPLSGSDAWVWWGLASLLEIGGAW